MFLLYCLFKHVFYTEKKKILIEINRIIWEYLIGSNKLKLFYFDQIIRNKYRQSLFFLLRTVEDISSFIF